MPLEALDIVFRGIFQRMGKLALPPAQREHHRSRAGSKLNRSVCTFHQLQHTQLLLDFLEGEHWQDWSGSGQVAIVLSELSIVVR